MAEREELIPLDLAPGERAELTVQEDDPWLLQACAEVAAFPGAAPAGQRVQVVPFWLEDVELDGDSWRGRGAGRLVLPPDGAPLPQHVPGEQVMFVAKEAITAPKGGGQGQACYVATWLRASGRPYVIEVWELRFDRDDTDGYIRVYWRPNFTLPKKPRIAPDIGDLSRKKRRALEDAISDVLEGKSKAGRKPKPRQPDLKFERRLEAAVLRLIERNGGDEPPIWRVQEAAGVKRDDYGRRVRLGGRTPSDVREWIKELAADYKRWLDEDVPAHYRRFGADHPPPQWEPRLRLRDLPRDFCD